jgi:hypothetical protein
MDDKQFISTAKSQVNWEKYKRGYWKVQDLDALMRRLREIDSPDELTIAEIRLLRVSANNSIKKIMNYDYQDLQDDNDTLRNEAMNPLHEFVSKLMEYEKGHESENQTITN